jgi:hypothetical protein
MVCQLVPIQTRRRVPPSKFEDIERQLRPLSKKSGMRQLADHVQGVKEVYGLLEDLRETVSDYQVCS